MKKEEPTPDCWWWLASLFMAFTMAVIAISCEAETPNKPTGEEGLPATIRLEVKANQPVGTRTRAVDENTIRDLRVLVYNKNGKLIGNKYGVVNYNSTTNTTDPFIVNTRIGGTDCEVYVLANTGGVNQNINISIAGMTTTQLTTWNELSKKSYLVMTGSKKVDITSATCTIGSISVSRIAARVTLDIKTDNTDITIKDYKVCSLPALTYYFPNPSRSEADKEDIGNVDAGKDAATDVSKWIEGTETTVDESTIQTTFYMYENRRGVKADITTQKDKIETNAPANATYVVINGEAGGYTATWVIYLGANNTSNFNIKRNCSYTYTIRLKEGSTADTRVDVDEKVFPTTNGTSSNCYIVPPGHAVTIPVNRANESPIAIGGTTNQIVATTEWEAEIVWQSSPFLLYLSRSTRLGKGANGRFTVAATDATKQGNAVVAIRNKQTRDILWSWHIWVTTYDGTETYTTNNGERDFVFMDRALGATSAMQGQLSACGLYYQWGRKDPFPGLGQPGGSWLVSDNTDPIRVYNSLGDAYEFTKTTVPPVTPNNLTNATRYPNTFYYSVDPPKDWFVYNSNSLQNHSLWSSVDIGLSNAAPKSIFDPCPNGWRVPPILNKKSPFLAMTASSSSWDNYGRTWSANAYFPTLGARDGGSGNLHSAGKTAFSWLASPIGTLGCNFYFDNKQVAPQNTNSRANALSVRCCQDNL